MKKRKRLTKNISAYLFIGEVIIEGIIAFTELIYDIFLFIIYGLTIKDPCKQCLVRACCTEKCKLHIEVVNYGPFGYSVAQKKFYSWLIVLLIILAIIIVIYLCSLKFL